MTTYGFTANGFVRKRLAVIRAEMRNKIVDAFGVDINTTADSGLAQLVDTFAGQASDLWEAVETVAQQGDPAQATGVGLRNIGAITGAQPKAATPSLGGVRFYGAVNTIIPEGFEVRSSTLDLNAVTTDAAVIPAIGFIDVPVALTVDGPIVVGANTFDTLVDFNSDVTSIDNPDAFAEGTDAETDFEFRVRREATLQAAGNGADRSTRAKLLELDWIQQALVISNRSDVVDANGFPPKSGSAIVWPFTLDADQRAEVVDILVRSTPTGIATNGDLDFTVTDDYGYDETYSFSFADAQDIHLDITVTTGSAYPTDGDALIRAAVVEFGKDFAIGEDVSLLRILCEVAKIAGVLTVEILANIGSAPGPGDNVDVPIGITEIAVFDAANITVNS